MVAGESAGRTPLACGICRHRESDRNGCSASYRRTVSNCDHGYLYSFDVRDDSSGRGIAGTLLICPLKGRLRRCLPAQATRQAAASAPHHSYRCSAGGQCFAPR